MYIYIDSGGNVSDLVVARNCCMARMLPGKNVQCFERSNGLDIALYKNYLYLSCHVERKTEEDLV